MSSISVKWQGVHSAEGMYALHRLELSGVTASVRSVKSYRCMSGGYFSAVYTALDKVLSRLENEKNEIRSLEKGISDILRAYENCENKIAGGIEAEKPEEKKTEEKKPEKEEPFKWKLKDTWKVIAKAGPVGAGIAAVGKMVTGKWETGVDVGKTIVSGISGINSAVKGVASIIAKGDQAGKKDWIGLNNGLTSVAKVAEGRNVFTNFGKMFNESMKKQFDFKLPENAVTADKVKLGCKWAGYAMTAVTNSLDNYEEFKGTGNVGRAVAETVIETATDIAVGAVATSVASAAIGAGLAAAGFTVAAPAVVVGAAAVGIAWAANGVCKWATGKFGGESKDLGEVAADFVCDTAEVVGKAVGNAAKSVKNTFTKWGKALFGS